MTDTDVLKEIFFEMPALTTEQKAIIYTRLRDGHQIRNIADELGISKNTVLLAKHKIAEYGSIVRKAGSGRPKISNDGQDIELINFLKDHPFETAIKAKEETHFPGSANTARRRIRSSDIKSCCATNKIFLTEANKQRRVEFAYEYINQGNIWETVIFSDEKTFQSCNNGKIRVYRPSGTRYDERYTNKTNQSGRFSINVWGWISARGPGVCQIVQGRLNAPLYCNILNQVMIPSVDAVYGQDFIFQQDNAPIHKARIVQNYLEENQIRVLPWPSKSPDINPIENVWGEMTKFMYKHNFQPRTRDELSQRIMEAWDTITQEYTRNLVLSMPRCLQALIDNNGATTKY